MYKGLFVLICALAFPPAYSAAPAVPAAPPAPPAPPTAPPAPAGKAGKAAPAAPVATAAPVSPVDARPAPGHFYVSPNGNDAWSGKLAEANPAKTDGPFATLIAAQLASRAEKLRATIFLRGGTYYLKEPLVF